MRSSPLTANSTQGLGSADAFKNAFAALLGISIVFRFSVEAEIRAGALMAVNVEDATIVEDIHVVVPSQTPSNSSARRFAAFLAEEAQVSR